MSPEQVRLSLAQIPWGDPARMRARAREIVVSAAAMVEAKTTQQWLVADERGFWEKTALGLLDRTPDLIAEKVSSGQMSAERAAQVTAVDICEQIATALATQAAVSQLSRIVSRGGR